MAEITLLDDATRPKAPRIGGLTATQRARGKRLALFHRLHLQQLGEVKRAMAAVERGEAEAATLGAAIASLPMAANYRAFGNLCGEECAVLTAHHTIEDRALFPVLQARGTEGLRRVVDRLQQEHHVVHALIEALEEAAERLIRQADGAAFAEAKERFQTLERVVRSHFGYEETELEDALGFLGIEI
ncbi:MAG: hemerythrin domain-containing protein [Bauldia sp.]